MCRKENETEAMSHSPGFPARSASGEHRPSPPPRLALQPPLPRRSTLQPVLPPPPTSWTLTATSTYDHEVDGTYGDRNNVVGQTAVLVARPLHEPDEFDWSAANTDPLSLELNPVGGPRMQWPSGAPPASDNEAIVRALHVRLPFAALSGLLAVVSLFAVAAYLRAGARRSGGRPTLLPVEEDAEVEGLGSAMSEGHTGREFMSDVLHISDGRPTSDEDNETSGVAVPASRPSRETRTTSRSSRHPRPHEGFRTPRAILGGLD